MATNATGLVVPGRLVAPPVEGSLATVVGTSATTEEVAVGVDMTVVVLMTVQLSLSIGPPGDELESW